jgi:hypothetical protein
MLRSIRSRMTFANVTSLVALFVALGGSSYAALNLPKGSVGAKQLRKNAVTSPKVKPGSLLLSDFRRAQRSRLRGPQGVAGPQGAAGPAGPQGPAGPITGTLPSGVTLRGVYGISARSTTPGSVQAPITYGLALPGDPATHYVPAAGPAPPQCPGDYNDPRALPGHLCVYEYVADGTTSVLIDFPAGTGSARFGAIVQGNTAGEVNATVKGTWAVTAP